MAVVFKEKPHGYRQFPGPPGWLWLVLILAFVFALVSLAAGDAVKPADVLRVQADLATDASGDYVPVPATPAVRQAIADALSPTAPPPATRPAVRPLARLAADTTRAKRGYGVSAAGGGVRSYADRDVRGFDQNFTLENIPGAKLDNVTSLYAYRDSPDLIYHGQLFYFGNAGGVEISNFYGGKSGGCWTRRTVDRTQYHHVIYSDFGTILIASAGICYQADNSGIQTRDGGDVVDVVVIGCGIGFLATQGDTHIRHLTIYDGGYYVDFDKQKRPSAWTGMVGLDIYSASVVADDVWIVGKKGQELGDDMVRASGLKRYPGPAVSLSPYKPDPAHPKYKPRPKGKAPLVSTNCRIAGWPGPAFGGGDVAHLDKRGWTVTPEPIEYDPSPVLAALERNEISKAEAVTTLTREIRGRVK
jgi:hypothetical protein